MSTKARDKAGQGGTKRDRSKEEMKIGATYEDNIYSCIIAIQVGASHGMPNGPNHAPVKRGDRLVSKGAAIHLPRRVPPIVVVCYVLHVWPPQQYGNSNESGAPEKNQAAEQPNNIDVSHATQIATQ